MELKEFTEELKILMKSFTDRIETDDKPHFLEVVEAVSLFFNNWKIAYEDWGFLINEELWIPYLMSIEHARAKKDFGKCQLLKNEMPELKDTPFVIFIVQRAIMDQLINPVHGKENSTVILWPEMENGIPV